MGLHIEVKKEAHSSFNDKDEFKIWLIEGNERIKVGEFHVMLHSYKKEYVSFSFPKEKLPNDKEVAYIDIFYIEPEYRRQGIGSQALVILEKLLFKEYGILKVWLSPSPVGLDSDEDRIRYYVPLLWFYDSHNYSPIHVTSSFKSLIPVAMLYEKELDLFYVIEDDGIVLTYEETLDYEPNLR